MAALEHVAVAEDEPLIRSLLQRFLKLCGYRTLLAHDGKQALEVAAQHPGDIDLLLSDVTMPGMDGMELAAKMTKNDPSLKITLMSGFCYVQVVVQRGWKFENYADHNPPPWPRSGSGRERLKEDFRLFWRATPGHHMIENQIAEGDKVVTRLTSIGKHEGDLPGAPPTGNELKMTSITIHRIDDGKLAEKWSEKDMLSFLRSIGIFPPMGAKQ